MLDTTKYGEIILEAVAGSTAYGLATADSDIDLHGVFVAPTERILGLFPPQETHHGTDPDVTYHEVGKYVRLALRCNPTVLELLFMDSYTRQNREGRLLVDNRDAFVSRMVYDSYGGYAMAQVRRLSHKDDAEACGRYGKHVRHCFRLLQQGRQLLETGSLSVVVPNPDELFELARQPVDRVLSRFEDEFARFRGTPTGLPQEPDSERANEMLLSIRRAHY